MDQHEPTWKALIHLDKMVQQELLAHQARGARLDAMVKEVALLRSHLHHDSGTTGMPLTDPRVESVGTCLQPNEVVAITNGVALPAKRAGNLNLKEFDIVFDIPTIRLWARPNPKVKSKLTEYSIKGLKRRRLTLLEFMLSHPRIVISPHKAGEIYQADVEVPPNTLSRTMLEFRRLLKQENPEGPYIIRERIWERVRTRDEFVGTGYMFNPEFHYLVVLKNFQDHQRIITPDIGLS